MNIILNYIRYNFYNSLCNIGDPIGLLLGEIITQPTTQMVLSSFHHSGTKMSIHDSLEGYKRILELTIPKHTIHKLTLKSFIKDTNDYEKVVRDILYVSFNDITINKSYITYNDMLNNNKTKKLFYRYFDKNNLEEIKKPINMLLN